MKPPLVQTPRSKRGFSLMAVAFTLAVLLMAAAVILNADNTPCAGPKPVVQSFLEGIRPVMLKYRLDLGSFPSQEQGLSVLKVAPSDKALAAKWQGPYVDPSKELLDPWKQPYRYRFPGQHNPDDYDLWSTGPDGKSGTIDDIGNWKTP